MLTAKTPAGVITGAGGEGDNGFYLNLVDATAKNLKVDTIDVTTANRARNSIDVVALPFIQQVYSGGNLEPILIV